MNSTNRPNPTNRSNQANRPNQTNRPRRTVGETLAATDRDDPTAPPAADASDPAASAADASDPAASAADASDPAASAADASTATPSTADAAGATVADAPRDRADGPPPRERGSEPRPEATADGASGSPVAVADPIVEARDLDVYYGDDRALRGVSLAVPDREVTALIGPSGCGKSTFLRSINRMNDRIDACRVDGAVRFDGQDVYDDDVDPVALRRRIGQVFQQPNPFPKSIYDNVAFGLRVQGLATEVDVDERVHRALERAALLEEVEDRLDESALALSGGQQQRLCLARAIAPDPDVLLMDEPASALDPVATSRIEDLIEALAAEYAVVIVTHNMQQAARISDRTAVFLTGGELVEYGDTETVFENPADQRVEDYVTGKFG